MNEMKTQRGKVTKNLNNSQMLGPLTLEQEAEQKALSVCWAPESLNEGLKWLYFNRTRGHLISVCDMVKNK